MTELMKRYEAERGGIMPCGMEVPGGFVYSKEYVTWLEAQLTCRQLSEKPEKAGVYFVEAKPYTGCESKTITPAYFDGESFLWHAVVRWLPIPPTPEGEMK